MKQKIIVVLTLLFMAFGCKKEMECGHENWKYIDLNVNSDCNFYVMYFLEGNYIFRIATSGKC